MHIHRRLLLLIAPATFAFGAGCAHTPTPAAAPVALPFPDRAPPDVPAPDSFSVLVETTRGPVVIMMHRDWAPRGVDRVYSLVRQHYYDTVAVFRVVPKFVAQFGLAADPRFTALYRKDTILDDSVRKSNLRGTVTFARSGANSRTAQLFINLVDNARLDVANGFGFAPIGQVVKGMELVDLFNAEYNATTPSQGLIASQGNAYLRANYPRLDYILRMTITKEWKRR
ncbi:MAG: peptidylprolyl isomerase [Gemmatimonadota bacterium]